MRDVGIREMFALAAILNKSVVDIYAMPASEYLGWQAYRKWLQEHPRG